jgi:hypothetical protein
MEATFFWLTLVALFMALMSSSGRAADQNHKSSKNCSSVLGANESGLDDTFVSTAPQAQVDTLEYVPPKPEPENDASITLDAYAQTLGNGAVTRLVFCRGNFKVFDQKSTQEGYAQYEGQIVRIDFWSVKMKEHREIEGVLVQAHPELSYITIKETRSGATVEVPRYKTDGTFFFILAHR